MAAYNSAWCNHYFIGKIQQTKNLQNDERRNMYNCRHKANFLLSSELDLIY